MKLLSTIDIYVSWTHLSGSQDSVGHLAVDDDCSALHGRHIRMIRWSQSWHTDAGMPGAVGIAGAALGRGLLEMVDQRWAMQREPLPTGALRQLRARSTAAGRTAGSRRTVSLCPGHPDLHPAGRVCFGLITILPSATGRRLPSKLLIALFPDHTGRLERHGWVCRRSGLESPEQGGGVSPGRQATAGGQLCAVREAG